jgi:hypothetical protein
VRLIEEFAQVQLNREHLLDARPQLGVTATGSVQVGAALTPRALECGEKDGFE